MSTYLLHMPGEVEQASEIPLRPQYLSNGLPIEPHRPRATLNVVENMPSFSRYGGIFHNPLNFKHDLEYLLNMPASQNFREELGFDEQRIFFPTDYSIYAYEIVKSLPICQLCSNVC